MIESNFPTSFILLYSLYLHWLANCYCLATAHNFVFFVNFCSIREQIVMNDCGKWIINGSLYIYFVVR